MPMLYSTRERLRTFFKPMTGHDDSANAQRWRFYGWILIAVGMGFNANLFYSLGSTCAISLAIMLVGITLDLVKLNALLTMAISWVRKETMIALGNLTFLLLLSLISLAAGFGFWSMTNERLETQRTQESLPFITAKDNYEAANKQVNVLSKYADININEERTKFTALNGEINAFLSSAAKNSRGITAGTVQSRIGDCLGDGYYERTYCGRLHTMQEKVSPIQQAIKNGEAYQTALKARQQASQDLQATAQSSRFVTAPIYMDLGKLFGKPPEVTRLVLMTLITLVIELTAIWCFINFNRFGFYGRGIEGQFEEVPEIVNKPKKSEKSSVKEQGEPVKWQVSHVSSTFNFDTPLQSNLARTENTSLNTAFNSRKERAKEPEAVARQTSTPNDVGSLQHHRQKTIAKVAVEQDASYLKRFAKFIVATK